MYKLYIITVSLVPVEAPKPAPKAEHEIVEATHMRLLGDSVQIKMPTKAKVRRLTKFVFLNLRDLQSPKLKIKYAGFAAGLYS